MQVDPDHHNSEVCSLCVLPKDLQTQFQHALLGPLYLCGACSVVIALVQIGARTTAASQAEQLFIGHVDSVGRVLAYACTAPEVPRGSLTESQVSTQLYP